MLLIAFFVWIAYAIIEGFREGYYWHYKNRGDDGNKYEIHPIFSAQRGLVLGLIGLLAFLSLNKLTGILIGMALLKSGLFVLSLMLMFSFIHNGMYYTTRNILNKKIYNLKWKDHSTTSTAKMTKLFNFRNRTIAFVLGLIGVLLLVIL
jgi:hypothetical protein